MVSYLYRSSSLVRVSTERTTFFWVSKYPQEDQVCSFREERILKPYFFHPVYSAEDTESRNHQVPPLSLSFGQTPCKRSLWSSQWETSRLLRPLPGMNHVWGHTTFWHRDFPSGNTYRLIDELSRAPAGQISKTEGEL